MSSFLVGHANGEHWRAASREATRLLGKIPPDANLGFFYATQEAGANMSDILRNLIFETGIQHWVGACGIGICATDGEYFGEPAVALMVGAFDGDTFKMFDTEKDDPAGWIPPGATDALGGGFAVVHGDPGSREILRMLPFFAETSGAFLAGGLTAPDVEQSQVAESVTGGGLSGILFSPTVVVATMVSQGCIPTGPLRHITESVRNVAVTIDNRPALEVLYEDAGEEYRGNLQAAAGRVFVAFPVEGSDSGDYVVRNLVGADEERGLIGIGAPIAPDQPILFCRRDSDTAREDLRNRLNDLKKRLPSKPRGAIYCSCVARGPHLFDENEEVGIVQEVLGDIPLVGFFGSGEISNDRLYTQTGVLSVFL
ncbi:MAG: FIST C-terminal domain-containing protein [Proteobacteria bacterium]|nr:FIST C-terminal domain-containing protein [Pseudomonadota bacterium]MDA1057686.1 FIST C-terminal domain-containing protein [Pseudomonadota bacterium]